MSAFRDRLLEGKVAIVTGGGSGIGAGIALRLAEHGATVGLVGRTASRLETIASRVRDTGGAAHTYPLDVRDYDALAQAVADLVTQAGHLDIVVCSAAGNFLAPASTLSAGGFKAVIDIDLLGTFNTCRASFDALAVQGGAVLSISATQAFIPTPLQCHAGAAKAAIQKLTQDLALEWGSSKIRVNALAPGPIADTEGMRRLAPPDGEVRERLAQALPAGRFGTIDEIADIALFLVSPAAGFITGTTLVADGGQSLLGGSRMLDVLSG